MKSNLVIFGLLLIFIIIVFIYSKSNKSKISSKEHYEDIFYAKDLSNDNWVSRPNFRADTSPRFDSTRVGGGYILGEFPGMSVQAAPLTPVDSLVSVSSPNYATMGGPDSAYADPRLPSGGLTSTQVNEILSQKFGRSSNGEYVDPKELLPVPDMKKALARDPSDPSTFMYDRYLFAPLKRRYPNVGVDFIRGDLSIPQLRMGWFDNPSVSKQDLAAGYFSDYLDIQQATSIKDSLFERKATPLEDSTPFGRLAEKTIYSLL